MSKRQYPKTCKQCGKNFQATDKRGKFCSRSCAITFNNKLPRRRMSPRSNRELCACGEHKTRSSCMCRRCKDKIVINRINLRTLQELKTTKGPSVYVSVRDHAKSIMHYHRIKRVCVLCGYSKYVETCHIKKIASFADSVCISDINNLKNLVFLCPNHHKELDNGLLLKEDLDILKDGSEDLT